MQLPWRSRGAASPADVLLRAEYGTFGERTVLEGAEDAVPMGFAGGLYDADTGLVHFGAREYDPETGRWTTKDPAGLGAGLNLYAYAGGDPVNLTDPTGEVAGPVIVGLVMIALALPASEEVAPDAFRSLLGEVGLAVMTWGASVGVKAAGVKAAGTGAARALPAARQIEAAWGASTYRHGGLMTGMEHIMYRHSAGSAFANVSHYTQGTMARSIVGYVDDALRYGTVTPNGAGAYMIEHNLGRVIGTNIAGDAARSIRVLVRGGVIQTAFPF